MKSDVEILASPAVAAADLAEIESELVAWGLRASASQLPSRRGLAEFSWLILLTIPAEVVVDKLLDDLGGRAYERLRALVERVLARYRPAAGPDRPPPGGVVIESATTGTQFALEADLPLDAYLQLFDELGRASSTEGLRVFHRESRRWRPSAPA